MLVVAETTPAFAWSGPLSLAIVRAPKVPPCEKRFVEEAVVAKKVVLVALVLVPKVLVSASMTLGLATVEDA